MTWKLNRSIPRAFSEMIRTRKLLKFLSRLVFTIVLLGALLHFVDWHKVLKALLHADVLWLFLVYAMVLVRQSIEAGQLSLILRFVGFPLTWSRVFLANALASFYGLITPGGVVSGVVKWTDLSAATGSRSTAFNAIVYNRFLLVVQPLLIGALALVWANPTGEPMLTVGAFVLTMLVLVGAGSLFGPRFPVSVARAVEPAWRRFPLGLQTRLEGLIRNLDAFRSFPISRHLWIATIGLLALAVGVVARLLVVKALGFSVPVTTILWVNAALVVTSHVPVTISNFGVREGVVIAAFALHGVPPDIAFAYGLVLYSFRLVPALFGAIYQLALVTGWASMKDSGAASG